jgi:hypothetical protein
LGFGAMSNDTIPSLRERIQLRKSCVISDSEHIEKENIENIPARRRRGRQCNKITTYVLDSDSDEDIEIDLKEDVAYKRRRVVVDSSDSDDEVDIGLKHAYEVKLHASSSSSCSVPIFSSRSVRNMESNPPSAELQAAFLKARQRCVKSCSFDLAQIASREVISTGRTIKKLPAWKGLWPPLRELFQNTIDHLGLMDPMTGRRHAALELRVISSGASATPGRGYDFMCGEQCICSIRAIGSDKLVIEQAYTYPLPPRALDTGVPDKSKQGANTAGGFGDGFKTAAVALLALSGSTSRELTWEFETAGQIIEWQFVGNKKDSIGAFAACQTLDVLITRQPLQNTVGITPRDNWMKQIIYHKGIAEAFFTECVPRLQVFWSVDESNGSVLSVPGTARGGGGDFLCDARELSPIPGPEGERRILPCPGVYVRGIWVRTPKIVDCIMSYTGSALDVNSRDRNDVDEEELLTATLDLLKKASQREVLRQLVEPLRGHKSSTLPTGERLRKKTKTSEDMGGWLFRTPRFSNRLLEMHREFFVHDVLGVAKGAVFVSSRTTASKEPFIVWACEFLKARQAPVYPIEVGSNKLLFEEVGEYELAGLVVKFLLNESKSRSSSSNVSESQAQNLKACVNKLFAFMGFKLGATRGAVKLIFSPSADVAFVHENVLVVPEQPLSRVLLLKIVNITQALSSSSSSGSGVEDFTNMVQAIFETIPGEATHVVSLAEVQQIVKRAKDVRAENASFLARRSSATAVSLSTQHAIASSEKRADKVIDLSADDSDHEDDGHEETGRNSGEKGSSSHETSSGSDSYLLTQQLRRISRRDPTQDELNGTIESSSFAEDGGSIAAESCQKPHSTLQLICADMSLGGGQLSVDAATATSINQWPSLKRQKLAALREICHKAMAMIGKSIPEMQPHLRRVRDGFDSTNVTYLGFCSGSIICINFAAYMKHISDDAVRRKKYPRDLLHEFVMTLTHEFAHLLAASSGHDAVWRDTHCSLLKGVYVQLVPDSATTNGGVIICQQCSQANASELSK